MSHPLEDLLSAPLWGDPFGWRTPYAFSTAMAGRGLVTVLDLLVDLPTSYVSWGAERDARHALAAARRIRARDAELERLAVERELEPHELQDDVDSLVFLEGQYERSRNWESVSAEMLLRGSEPMEFGEFRTDTLVATLFLVPLEHSGSRLWVLSRMSLDDIGDPMLFSEFVFPQPAAKILPRWSGLPLGVSIARLIATTHLFDQMQCIVAQDETHYVHDLAVAHTPTGEVHVDDDRLTSALAWLAKCAAIAPAEEVPSSVAWGAGEPVLPQARMLKGHVAAEEYAAEVLVALGFRDARRTPTGADGGVDVAGSGVVAQVKMEALPTGRDRLQALFGVASVERARAVFFSLAGYTAHAIEWADRAGVSLLEFEFDGTIVPVNEHGRMLIREGVQS